MTVITPALPRPEPRRRPISTAAPLTLVASLTVLLFMGALITANFLSGGQIPPTASESNLAVVPTLASELSAECRRHVVQSGETLQSIAAKFFVDIEALRFVNRLGDAPVNVGQSLIIPNSNVASCLEGIDPVSAFILPEGNVAVQIPIGVNEGVRVGNIVDVVGVMLVADSDDSAEGIIYPALDVKIARIVLSAIVVPSLDDTQITLSVSVDDAETLLHLVEAEIPLLLLPAVNPEVVELSMVDERGVTIIMPTPATFLDPTLPTIVPAQSMPVDIPVMTATPVSPN